MTERLQKFLARAGVASRRRSEELIRAGRIKVNGKIVTEMGTQVEPYTDVIMFDGQTVSIDERYVYMLAYKPRQMISAASDPEGRPVVTSLVPGDYGRLYPVGRLDWDSEGAIILTNDGELTQLLTHPKHEVHKVYMTKLRGRVSDTDEGIRKVREGVRLDDGYQCLPVEVTRDSTTEKHTWFVVAIMEGKNRQIRRMFEAVGMTVLKLKRIAYGPVNLGDMLPEHYRRLSDSEVDELYMAAGRKRPSHKASRGRVAKGRREGDAKRQQAAAGPDPRTKGGARTKAAAKRTGAARGGPVRRGAPNAPNRRQDPNADTRPSEGIDSPREEGHRGGGARRSKAAVDSRTGDSSSGAPPKRRRQSRRGAARTTPAGGSGRGPARKGGRGKKK